MNSHHEPAFYIRALRRGMPSARPTAITKESCLHCWHLSLYYGGGINDFKHGL